jgi:hypothetical protein
MPAPTPAEVALEEFKALRTEIITHIQAQTTLVGVGMTAAAAIGAFAFGGKNGTDPQQLEILLVLPFVLGGLGLAYLAQSSHVHSIGEYLRDHLWRRLFQGSVPDSWENFVTDDLSMASAFNAPGALSWLPGVLIFGGPGIAALAINWRSWTFGANDISLRIAWSLDVLVIALAVGLTIAVGWSRWKKATKAS